MPRTSGGEWLRQVFGVADFTVTTATRQLIIDEVQISGIRWFGAVDDVAFLEAVWDLGALPSNDPRFRDAAGDIWQHRANNDDWDDDWIVHDRRFDLLNCDGNVFLRFLCRMVDPAVRRDPDEVERLARFFNASLATDGVELRPQRRPAIDGSTRNVYEPTRRASRASPLQLNRFGRLTDPQALADHLRRIDSSVEEDPALAIGSSKELVESLCRMILDDYGEPHSGGDDLLELYKKAATALRLSAESVPSSSKGSHAAQRALRALATTVQSLAELRNQLGIGHGRAKASPALARHARLAAAASRGITEFMLETWHVRQTREQPVPQGPEQLVKHEELTRPTRVARFKHGDQVRHPTFGSGVVVKSTLTALDEELVVRFDKAGLKILSATVAPLKLAAKK
jgi:hypothetical protein